MSKFDPYSYFFELPLYARIQVTDTEGDELIELLYSSHKIDAYNPTLKENTTYAFSSSPGYNGYSGLNQRHGIIRHYIKCARTNEEFHVFSYFDYQTKTLQKVGQYLSIADFHISQIKQYNTVLPKEQLKEFTRAIGLAANGVGIGSFVYLRRIFETLMEDAHQKALTDQDWNDEKYNSFRISERIELLKNHLPNFLVENKALYSILSKGIHSLTENECLEYFETVKVGIEFILDEKLEKYEREKKMEEARKRISSLSSKLK